MSQKSKQLEAMLQGVIAATPEKLVRVAEHEKEIEATAPPTGGTTRARPAPKLVKAEAEAETEAAVGAPSIASEWLEEERESFDCPVIVKRHLARLAVDRPDLSVRGLYLQAVAQVYGIEIPYEVLRDRRRRRNA